MEVLITGSSGLLDIAIRETCDWFKLHYPNVRGV